MGRHLQRQEPAQRQHLEHPLYSWLSNPGSATGLAAPAFFFWGQYRTPVRLPVVSQSPRVGSLTPFHANPPTHNAASTRSSPLLLPLQPRHLNLGLRPSAPLPSRLPWFRAGAAAPEDVGRADAAAVAGTEAGPQGSDPIPMRAARVLLPVLLLRSQSPLRRAKGRPDGRWRTSETESCFSALTPNGAPAVGWRPGGGGLLLPTPQPRRPRSRRLGCNAVQYRERRAHRHPFRPAGAKAS